MKKFLISYFLFSFFLIGFTEAQSIGVNCYPANWWIGMKHNKIQLMFHSEQDIGNAKIQLHPTSEYPPPRSTIHAKIIKIHRVENKHYVFVDLEIPPNAIAEEVKFSFEGKDFAFDCDFELKLRRKGNGSSFAQGVTSKDFMYLIMPDRFSNGDPSNDKVAGMRDQSLDRDTVFNRHGGDLKGIQNHLDYIQNLGVTTLWLNPVIENDMPDRTEHGYAFTDHYKIDPRLGGEVAYQNLIEATHAKGMKIIQDAVYNHVGLYHFTVQDLPMKDWLHQWPEYINTTYKDQTIFDPYASATERKKMTDGWFTKQMPDLNQGNSYVANFLIQHALWTVEEFGIDGWRIDTYAYNDLDFMNRCNKALMDEYPQLTLFGETWVHGVPNQSYFVQNNYNIPFKSNLQASTDFQTLWAITDAMTKDFGWDDGINKLYTTLAQDFVYKDPTRQVIFLDNHDMDRFFSVVKEDVSKYQTALTWLLTCRGIPEIYYSDELSTTGTTHPNDGHVRLDFPGGFAGDAINKFTAAGRTKTDDSIYNHIATLANFRKTSSALTTGKFMQYVPEDGVYVYFRYDNKQTVMVVMNTSKEEKKLSFAKYAERTNGFTHCKDVISKNKTTLEDFTVGTYKAVVLELLK